MAVREKLLVVGLQTACVGAVSQIQLQDESADRLLVNVLGYVVPLAAGCAAAYYMERASKGRRERDIPPIDSSEPVEHPSGSRPQRENLEKARERMHQWVHQYSVFWAYAIGPLSVGSWLALIGNVTPWWLYILLPTAIAHGYIGFRLMVAKRRCLVYAESALRHQDSGAQESFLSEAHGAGRLYVAGELALVPTIAVLLFAIRSVFGTFFP